MAKKPKTLQDLFEDTLKDVYYAENKILKTLPKMAKAAQSRDLKAAFIKHERETRGQVARLEKHVPLDDYAPLPESIPSESIGLVTCYVGLHHMTVDKLMPFLQSVRRVLRPGGAFVVRDHDVDSEDMRAIVSLAHTVFNAGLGETWETNVGELRFFESAKTWVERLQHAGFEDTGHRILQANDPTRNTLFCFVKPAASVAVRPHGIARVGAEA